MSVAEIFAANYAWADGHAWGLLVAAVAFPAVGTALTGLAGLVDGRWGRRVASLCVGVGIGVVAFEVSALLVAHYWLDQRLLDADVILLIAPVVCLAASIGGIGLLLPVAELASVRAAFDIGLFGLAALGCLWLLSKFRGWGFIFFGSIADFVVIGVCVAALLRRLYVRAFGDTDPSPASFSTG